MIYALGDVSGAHFNPAVTFAIILSERNKITVERAFAYFGAQLVGAFAAANCYWLMTKDTFGMGPQENMGWLQTFIAELIFTFVLCYVVLTVATTKTPSKDMFGLAIGACIIVGGYAAGPISGAALNPAVAIGTDLVHCFWPGGKGTSGSIHQGLIYAVAE